MTRMTRSCLALAALLCVAAGPPPEDQRIVPGGRAGFVSDGTGGCWLWASGLRAGASDLTASWTGPCPEGPAEGEGRGEIHWREGETPRAMIYEGPLRRGKAEGQGRLTISSGKEVLVVQHGEFRDDHFIGGRVELPRPGLVYEGGWLLAHPNGRGRLNIDGRVLEGDWRNGCLRMPRGWFAFTRAAEECEGTDT